MLLIAAGHDTPRQISRDAESADALLLPRAQCRRHHGRRQVRAALSAIYFTAIADARRRL